MMISSRVMRSLAIAGATVAVTLGGAATVSAAPAAPKPATSCKLPVFAVSPTTTKPGTKITVLGQNFSGCSAQGNPAKPTAVLTVKIGVVTAAKVTDLVATTKTSATGSFSVQITVPKVSAGGQPEIILAAESVDPVTKLAYTGFRTISYTNPTSTPAPTSTSVDVPTAVPAGSGGFGAPTSSSQIGTELGLGAAGAALVALGGGLGLARRRVRQH